MVQRWKLLSSWSTSQSHLTLAFRSCTLISDQLAGHSVGCSHFFTPYFSIFKSQILSISTSSKSHRSPIYTRTLLQNTAGTSIYSLLTTSYPHQCSFKTTQAPTAEVESGRKKPHCWYLIVWWIKTRNTQTLCINPLLSHCYSTIYCTSEKITTSCNLSSKSYNGAIDVLKIAHIFDLSWIEASSAIRI